MTASDNVMVTRVQVSILVSGGRTPEQGQAAQPDPRNDPDRCEYLCNAEGTVTATAWDLAGNQTVAVIAPQKAGGVASPQGEAISD